MKGALQMKRFGLYMAAATIISMGISTAAALPAQAACPTAITGKNFQAGCNNFSDNGFFGGNAYDCFWHLSICKYTPFPPGVGGCIRRGAV